MSSKATNQETIRNPRCAIRNQLMRALALCAPEKMELCEVASPEVGPRQILIRSGAVGLCGTDFHIYQGHANYNTDDSGRLIPLERAPANSGA